MFVTDGAATMSVVGCSLQKYGCDMIHVTKVDALIANTKKVFLKSLKRLRAFHSRCPNILEPPQPIPTRWGIRLEAAFYYAKYYEKIKAVILEFNPNEAATIKER
ncbi:hypothetical protein NQ318_005193 [Aromia moschata]|uniref:Uncharacterized protein n=1 Tax=Aromia moschata TaxID=1265417 RepID=A0AAV8YBU9_9CUCU|nr:hypothetical protein NQ318_005193 [Aromia moschata]